MRASRPSPEPDLKPRTAGRGAKEATPPAGGLRALPIVRDDVALVAGLRGGEAWARAALFDRYAPHVERILRRVLGNDRHGDMADLVQDSFVQALASLEGLRDAEALLAWMQTIAARTAFRAIRARKARAWLKFWEPTEVPDVVVDGVDPTVLEAHRHTYALLERMPAEERVIFALRYIDGMELERIAEIREVSLATLKRRLARAEQRFAHAAQRDRVLEPWLKEGGRWTT
jgi:RNA polymerase sigma-70 factor (ECF subfamily)